MSDSANAQSLTPAEEIAALIKRSRAAQQQIEHYTQEQVDDLIRAMVWACLLYTSPSPRDQRGSRMPSSA